jgi:hypothetical protein
MALQKGSVVLGLIASLKKDCHDPAPVVKKSLGSWIRMVMEKNERRY